MAELKHKVEVEVSPKQATELLTGVIQKFTYPVTAKFIDPDGKVTIKQRVFEENITAARAVGVTVEILGSSPTE